MNFRQAFLLKTPDLLVFENTSDPPTKKTPERGQLT